MSKYGKAAILAVDLIRRQNELPPRAWKIAMEKTFPNSVSSREKGCPRNAFLGLCEDGFITGVPAGNYTKSIKNKEYAVKATSNLQSGQLHDIDTKKLWHLVSDDNKTHNHQMDIVLTLWINNYIHRGKEPK